MWLIIAALEANLKPVTEQGPRITNHPQKGRREARTPTACRLPLTSYTTIQQIGEIALATTGHSARPRVSRRAIFGLDQSAHQRLLQIVKREKVRSHKQGADRDRIILAERCRELRPRRHIAQRLRPVANGQIVLQSCRARTARTGRVFCVSRIDLHERVEVFVYASTQELRVVIGEDTRADAYDESQRQDDGCRQQSVLAQAANGETNILGQLVLQSLPLRSERFDFERRLRKADCAKEAPIRRTNPQSQIRHWNHSCLSATNGSTLVARRAGK